MNRWGWIGSLVLGALLVLAGCGGPECAEGTVEQDGECILDAEAACGVNAHFDNGQCVADDPVSCGEDTELAADDNTCYPSDEVCTEGTAFSSQQQRCVPTDDVCAPGTTFDDDARICYPDAECSPGDVIVDGECLSEAQQRAADADVVAEGNTDPELGGEPVDLSLGDVGDAVDFTGTIGQPEDLDGDGSPDRQIDHFQFEADAGDTIEVSVESLGLPDPGLKVEYAPTDDNGADSIDFQRFTPTAVADKTRQFMVPADGMYYVSVHPGSTLNRLVGDADWSYVGTVRRIESASASDISFATESFAGALGDPEDNFVRTDEFGAGDQVQLRWTRRAAHAQPVVQLWSAPGEFVDELVPERVDGASWRQLDAASFEVPDSGSVYLTFDWTTKFGQYPHSYDVDAVAPSTVESEETIEAGFSADDGDAVEIGWDAEDTEFWYVMLVTVTDEDDDIVEESYVGANDRLRIFDLDEGDYTVAFTSPMQDPQVQFLYDIIVSTPEPVASFEAEQHDAVVVTQFNTDEALTHLDIVHDDSGQSVAESTISVRDSSSPVLDSIQLDIGADDGEFTVYHYDFHDPANLEVTADVTSPEAIATFSGDIHDDVIITQSNDDGHSIRLDVRHDATDQLIDSDPWMQTHITFDFTLREYEGDFTVYHYDFDDTDGLDVDVETITPSIVDAFQGSAGDLVTLTQDNDDNDSVRLDVVNDDTDAVARSTTLYYTSSQSTFDIPEDGSYLVYFYDYDDTQGLDVSVDHISATTIGSFEVSGDDETGVVTISHDYDDESSSTLADDLNVAVVTDGSLVDTGTFNWDAHGMAIVNVKSGEYTVKHRHQSDPDADSTEITVTTSEPDEITDFGGEYTGTSHELIEEAHDYYLVELDTTTSYEMTFRHEDGDGFSRLFVYGLDHELLYRLDDELGSGPGDDDVASIEFEFEADTPYLIRIGNDGNFGFEFDYSLTFEAVD